MRAILSKGGAPIFMNSENSVREWTIDERDNGLRLDAFLARELNVSRSRARELCAVAKIANTTTSGVKPSHVLRTNQRLLVEMPDEKTANPEYSVPPDAHEINLPAPLFEDEHILVLNKPRGLVVHEGAGETGATLVDVLRARGVLLSGVGPPERAGIVHRLDKETTGLMVVCKTDAAHWKLAEDFAARRVHKEYLALVCGVPPLRGRIEAPIFRHPAHRKKMAVVATGRPAITEYSVEKSWPRFALLRIHLLTGRTHQIRVHCAHLNYPVVGDALYGGAKRALQSAPDEDSKRAMENLRGQALHAALLRFTHPLSGEEVQCEAPPPDDFAQVLNALNDAETRA